jgi:dUTP pyrophosphatase
MKIQETQIAFSSNENEPDIECYTALGFRSFWDRVRFAYNILIGNNDFTSGFDFPDNVAVKETIDILKDKLLDESFNFSLAFTEAIAPSKAHKNDVGYDLHTPIDFALNPGEMKRIDFGIIVDIKPGYEIQVRNRSSVVWKYNTMMSLGTGTIDCDYRGHIMAPFYNFGVEQMRFQRGDRLAQMVIKKTEDITLTEGKVNLNTERGSGGFGSSFNKFENKLK